MRLHQLSDNELREQLKQEIERFKELAAKKELYKNQEVWSSHTIQDYELLKSQWKDSAEQIAYLYKKLHPYFPVGTCPYCGSVTSKIVGSGRNHYVCVACGEETIS